MESSVSFVNQGADHRANSGASYAPDRKRQPQRVREIRTLLFDFFNTRQIFDAGKMSHRSETPSLVGSKTAGKRETWRFVMTFVAGFGLVCLCGVKPVSAQVPSENPPVAVQPSLVAHLTSDFRSAITDRPLRASLESVATAANVNLWLDRRVDPTVPVRPEPDSTTPYQAIAAIAKSAGLQAAAVDNVVLVGRAEWVENVMGAILTLPAGGGVENISWTDLTTPNAAVASINIAQKSPLPHDLWPAIGWTEMNVNAAHCLIAAQFDRVPSSTDSRGYQALTPTGKVAAIYPRGPHMPLVRSAVMEADKTAIIKESNSQILIKAHSKAHVAANQAWLGRPPAKAVTSLDIDQVRFTLRLENAVAEQVFRQLATAAGRKITVAPNAVASCAEKVSLTANNETLRELSQRVADSVGVTLTWTASQLEVAAE